MSTGDMRPSQKDALIDVMSRLVAESEKTTEQAYRLVAKNSIFKKAKIAIDKCNPEMYTHHMMDMHAAIDGQLVVELPTEEARFLYRHAVFVEAQFCQVFEKLEGVACSSDKARTVMRALAHSLVTNEPIVFDYKQEVTFHLPRDYLTTDADIKDFFGAILRLYYGDNSHYLLQLSRLYKGVKDV